MDPFLNQDDTVARLDNTIVLYRGCAVYVRVRNTDPLNTIRLYKIGASQGDNYRAVLATDPDLEVYDFNLGYCNIGARAYYAARRPVRRYKQGLSVENIMFKPAVTRDGYSTHAALKQMLENTYPSFEEALTKVSSRKAESCAFDRALCLERDDTMIFLRYKGTIIGTYDKKRSLITLMKDIPGISFYMDLLRSYSIPMEKGE